MNKWYTFFFLTTCLLLPAFLSSCSKQLKMSGPITNFEVKKCDKGIWIDEHTFFMSGTGLYGPKAKNVNPEEKKKFAIEEAKLDAQSKTIKAFKGKKMHAPGVNMGEYGPRAAQKEVLSFIRNGKIIKSLCNKDVHMRCWVLFQIKSRELKTKVNIAFKEGFFN